MGRPKRAEQFNAKEIGIVHCYTRCVRRAFLAGLDPLTGISYEFRREWIRRRLELISAVYGLDVLTYSILSNHLHVVLRTRPDVVKAWSNQDVATRWLRLFPGKRIEEHLGEPTREAIAGLCANKKKLKNIRIRLSDPSWFMKSLAEPIARLANRQDGVTGHFWEERFKAQKIVDEAGLLACAMYVDLNPIRAAMAQSLELSTYTSAYDRILALQGEEMVSAAMELPPKTLAEEALEAMVVEAEKAQDTKRLERVRAKLAKLRSERDVGERKSRRIPRDGWLAPLELPERELLGAQPSRSGVRASDKGFLNMKLADYLKLLDWTGRQGRSDKRGKIPASVAPILARLGIEGTMWSELVWNFKKYFGRSRALGKPESLKQEAAKQNRGWVRGQRKVTGCFS